MAGFLDAVGGGPLHPAALETLSATWSGGASGGWGSPRALHRAGRQASRIRAAALASLAEVLGVRPDELHLTADGSAARRLAVAGTAHARRRIGPTVVISAVEHATLLDAADAGAAEVVEVDATGLVRLDRWTEAVGGTGVAVAVLQAGNQETATRQPLLDASAATTAAGIPLVVDLGAAVGRVEVPHGLGDIVIADAATWGGPALGVVAVRTGARFTPPVAPYEPPVPVLAAAAAALVAAEAERGELAATWQIWDEQLRIALHAIADTDVAGPASAAGRLPGIVSASFLYLDGEALVEALSTRGLSVASGSACTTEDRAPSHVLAAMGLLTQGNARVSFGRWTTQADVDHLIEVLPGVVAELRTRAGV
jgi:cysteine desulfurase